MSLLKLSSFMTKDFVRYLVGLGLGLGLQVYRFSKFCSDFLCCFV